MRAWTAAILVVVSASVAGAQPTLSINSTEALIGDHLQLTLEVGLSPGQQWVNQDVVPADTVAAIELISSAVPEVGQGLVRKRWMIAVFDTGGVRIPPVPVIVNTAQGPDTLYSNDVPLQIAGVLDSAGLAPIKPITYEPVRFSDYLPYIAGAAVLALLILAGIWWSRRPQKEAEVVEIRDERPPHVLAIERLDALDRQQLWQQGQIKAFHSELSHIVREYLERRFGIQALESTSNEIIAQLRRMAISGDLLEETARMMEVEDLVKFAKAQPPVEVHATHLTFVREFVDKTKMMQQTIEDDV